MKTYNGLPSVWRFGDFVAFCLGAVVCIGFLVFGLFAGFQGTSSAVKQAPYLLSATAAGFLFVYWRVIRIRQNDIAGFVAVGNPKYGILVHLGDYKPAGEDLGTLSKIVDETVQGWTKVWALDTVEGAVAKDLIWVWFKPGDLDLPFNMPGKVAGFDVYRKMVVGYKPGSTFERTAFAHELGHVIQGTITNRWDQVEHHARSKENGLP